MPSAAAFEGGLLIGNFAKWQRWTPGAAEAIRHNQSLLSVQFSSGRVLLAAAMIVASREGFKALFLAASSALGDTEPSVNSLFRIGTCPRLASTKSTPSAVRVKSELSAWVMYFLFQRYHVVNC